MTGIRVVETGVDPAGRSTIAADRTIEATPLPTGRLLHTLWNSDELVPPAAQGEPAGVYPGPGGGRFWVLVVPPDVRDRPPALHVTSTVDLGVVLSGRVTLETEDASSADIGAGEAFIQHGTAHRWLNPHKEPAVLAVVVIGTGARGSGTELSDAKVLGAAASSVQR